MESTFDDHVLAQIMKRMSFENLGIDKDLDILIFKYSLLNRDKMLRSLMTSNKLRSIHYLLEFEMLSARQQKICITSALDNSQYQFVMIFMRHLKEPLHPRHASMILSRLIRSTASHEVLSEILQVLSLSGKIPCVDFSWVVNTFRNKYEIGLKLFTLRRFDIEIPMTKALVESVFYTSDTHLLRYLQNQTVPESISVDFSIWHSDLNWGFIEIALECPMLRPMFSEETIDKLCQYAARCPDCLSKINVLFRQARNPLKLVKYFTARQNYDLAMKVMKCNSQKWDICPISSEIGDWPFDLMKVYLSKHPTKAINLMDFWSHRQGRPAHQSYRISRLADCLTDLRFRIDSTAMQKLVFIVEFGDVNSLLKCLDEVPPSSLAGYLPILMSLAFSKRENDMTTAIRDKMIEHKIAF